MLSRRHLLLAGAATTLFIVRPAAAARGIPDQKPGIMLARRLSLLNRHTGETFADVYWANGAYIPEALRRIDHVLRDHYNDRISPIDTGLIDMLARLQARLGLTKPIEVLSAYRSPETNAAIRRRNGLAVKNSYHLHGKAVDICVSGFSLWKLRQVAITMKAGGVGWYPALRFVHLDCGPFRTW